MAIPNVFNDLDKKLWTAADRLRSNLDATVYKQAFLGLIFLKYVSDSFAHGQAEIKDLLKDPKGDFFIVPADYKMPRAHVEAIHSELEARDYYMEEDDLGVPALARWNTVQDPAKLPPGTEITEKTSAYYRITSTGKLGNLSVYGQDNWAGGARLRRAPRARRVVVRRKQPNKSTPTTWRLTAMNMAIRGIDIDFDFGKPPANSFANDHHPYRRADYSRTAIDRHRIAA